MNAKLAACLLALLLLIGWVLYLVGGGREELGRGRGAADAAAPAPSPASLSIEEPPRMPEGAPLVVEREAALPVSDGAPANPWRGELAGLIGRVVENDGTPVAGMRVALLEFDPSVLFDGSRIDGEEPSLELEETATDREGRFVLGGARGPAFHALGVDLGGPRATIRVIDQALPHRERTDIGDVVLAPFGVLTGRVVDEAGAPVAGARIRAGPFPEELLGVSAYEFRSDSLIAFNLMAAGEEGQAVIELPGWIRHALERLPVPTTASDATGAFRLEGVALAQIVGGVDKRGYVGVPIGPVDLSSGAEDLGDLVLARGRTIRGVVEDTFGEPLAGVEVHAGAEVFPSVAAILQPCGKTDGEGRFELTGVAESAQVVAVSRRAPHERWGSAVSASADDLLVELEANVQLTVNVRNTAGQPLSGARIQLTPGSSPGAARAMTEVLMVLPKPVTPADVFREVEAGRYECARVSAGTYDITASFKGLAPGILRAECLAERNEVTLTCTSGSLLELRVLDAVTRAPVVGARGSILRVGASGFTKLAVESTDPDGRARLGPLPEFMGEEGLMSGFLPASTMVLVQHPRYGDHSATLEPHTTSLVVELASGGTLTGRVHWGGAIPTRLYMLTLMYQGADGFLEVFHLPRFALSDLAGEFRVANLAPGEYRVDLSERFLNQDPLPLMNDDFDPPTLYRGEVVIRDGETSELVIDLSPTGRGATARLVGRVRLDGRSLEGAEVSVRGNESVQVQTDAWGRFETPFFSILGSTWVSVEGEVQVAGGPARRMQLHQESLELQQDEVREIDLDLYPLTLRARVVDAAHGEPVPGAQVSALAKGQQSWRAKNEVGTTDAAGEAALLVFEAGEYVLTASASGFGKASSQVEMPAEGLTEVTPIELQRSVPCAGHIALDPSLDTGARGFAYLHVQGEGNPNGSGTPLKPPDYAFELEGLSEGKYRAWIYIGGRQGEQASFELGPDGERELVLEFVPSAD